MFSCKAVACTESIMGKAVKYSFMWSCTVVACIEVLSSELLSPKVKQTCPNNSNPKCHR